MKRILHDLPATFGVTENIYIPLKDGTRLSTRVWLPKNARGSVEGKLSADREDTSGTAKSKSAQGEGGGDAQYPAILEYIPYRKRDGTRTRDEPMHGYFCGHGYACVRVDMRGSGESDGVLYDEYLKQEQDDALEVIEWIASQPWCSGTVGMMGKSWGGFNSLQVAARRPKALRAIIVLGFTDNRFKDDIHWKGGCLLNDNFWWGSLMQAFLSQPPDPAIVGKSEWKARWLQHLETIPFNAATWASHQTYDSYWRHGSVCEDYSAIQVPVLMVDGWADSYTNPVFRLLESLTVPCRAIVGPWVHAYPQDGVPSPPMNFLEEATQWWDHWLKGMKDNGAMDAPKLQVYVEDSMSPCTSKPVALGSWHGLPAWPSPSIFSVSCHLHPNRTLHVPQEAGGVRGMASPLQSDGASDFAAGSPDGSVEAGSASGNDGGGASAGSGMLLVHTPLNHGLLSGEWMGAGVLGETAGDQRMDNGLAVTFTSAPLQRPVAILGRPTFEVELTSDKSKALLFVQLCDVAPDGAATRISYGLRNLVHTGPDGDAGVQLLRPETPVRATVELDYCGYRVPPGHRIVLSIANNYWPMVWPSPEDTTLRLRLPTAVLQLPVMDATATSINGPNPLVEKAPPTPVTLIRPGRVDRTIQYDIVRDSWTCVTDGVGGVFGEGVYRFDDIDTTIEHNLKRELTLSNRDPLSAHYKITQRFNTSRPGWNTQVDIVTTQVGDAAYLHLRTNMKASLEGELVFEKNWYERVPRLAI